MPSKPDHAPRRDKSLVQVEIFCPISLLIHTGSGRIGLSDHINQIPSPHTRRIVATAVWISQGRLGLWTGDINLPAATRILNSSFQSGTLARPSPRSKRRKRSATGALLKMPVWRGLLRAVRMLESGAAYRRMSVEPSNVEPPEIVPVSWSRATRFNPG